jgi:hypothetical protein
MKPLALCLAAPMLAATLAIAASIPMQEVDSSFIYKIGYDSATQTMAVQMQNSSDLYHYSEVPVEVYENFLAAESKGNYFVANVKGKFESALEP